MTLSRRSGSALAGLAGLLVLAAATGCASDDHTLLDDFTSKQAEDKADASGTGLSSYQYLGRAELSRDAAAFSLAGVRAHKLYVLDLDNPESKVTYDEALEFVQQPLLPDPEDVDLDSPPIPPVATPPVILAYGSTEGAPLAPITCLISACPIDGLDAPDSAYLGRGQGSLALNEIAPSDRGLRLLFLYPDPIDPNFASLEEHCSGNCE